MIGRYFGQFNPSRRDRWVFGSRETRFYLHKFAWILIDPMVAGTASPDDPSLTDYWAQQRRRSKPPMDTATRAGRGDVDPPDAGSGRVRVAEARVDRDNSLGGIGRPGTDGGDSRPKSLASPTPRMTAVVGGGEGTAARVMRAEPAAASALRVVPASVPLASVTTAGLITPGKS